MERTVIRPEQVAEKLSENPQPERKHVTVEQSQRLIESRLSKYDLCGF